MAKTAVADIIIPTEFEKYAIERTAELEQAMTMRTTKSTVMFARPFRLGALGDQYPAGRYPIETDDELPEGIYFPTHRRATTTMQLIADPMHPGVAEFAMVDPERLAEALAADTERAPVISIDPPQVAL